MENNDYIYLIDEVDEKKSDNNRMKSIFDNMIDGKIKIEDLAIYDILKLCEYLIEKNKFLDQKIYLKKINLSLLIQKLSETNE